MSCDLWPLDSEFELDLYFTVIYLHIKNIPNPSIIFEVIVRKPIWIYNELTFDLWPADSEFELDLYFSVIYLHIKNIQNPSNIFEVIVRKPIWIYNELWPLTFDLRTPNSNLTCILVSSTYISKISKIRLSFLKLLCGNQFEYIMSCDLWPADSEFELDLYFSVIYLHIKNIQNPSIIFKVIVRKPIWIYNELWPLTFDLRTPNSNLTCISVSSTYASKIFKIRPTFLKLLCGNQFEYIMSCDLWPTDSEFELDLYFSVIYLHIKNIQNPSIIFEVIVRKPIWIYNELWPLTFVRPLTFDLRTPNSNLTCISVSSTYASKIFKIWPTFLKLLCGNQFEYIMSCDLWPLTYGLRIRTWPVFWCHLPTSRKYPKSVQDFWSYFAETNSGDGRTDGQVQRIMPPPDFVCGGIKIQKTFTGYIIIC